MGILKNLVLKFINKQAEVLTNGITEAQHEQIQAMNEKIEKTNVLLFRTTELLGEIQYNNPRHPQYLFYKVCERAQEQTIDYIYSDMMSAICITDYEQFLHYCYAQCKDKGDVFEFGVFSGYTINFFAELASNTDVYGFDSFEGLPEDWQGYHYFDFNRNGNMPEVRSNVNLVQGWFSESIPNFLSTYEKKDIKLMHVDCDLYSSTKDIFDNLEQHIKKDLIIVFDEYFNYPNYQQHEFKAFKEFVAKNNISYQYIAYCGERVAVKIN